MLLVVCVAALVVMAGCNLGGGSDDGTTTQPGTGAADGGLFDTTADGTPDTAGEASPTEPRDGGTAAPPGPGATATAGATDDASSEPAAGSPTADPTATATPTPTGPTLASETANQTAALQAAGSYVIRQVSRTGNGSTAVVSNRTIRANVPAERMHLREQRRLIGGSNLTLESETFRTGDTVYVRSALPGANTTIYERHALSSFLDESEDSPATNLSQPADLATQFDFDHDRTSDGDHRFSVDSPDQVLQPPANGTIERVSMTLIVDADTGLVTRLDYHLEMGTTEGRLVLDVTQTVTGLGSTSVSDPAWLPTARNQTTPSG